MQNETENLEFVQGVNFEFISSMKNNGTKYLLIFHDSCAEICIYKALSVDATAGRHSGFRTSYIEHNLLHPSKNRRGVQLQNKHIAFFKSPRDVHGKGTLGVQLGLGSTLVGCYCDATSVPIGHLLIDLSLGTDDRIRYCTNG